MAKVRLTKPGIGAPYYAEDVTVPYWEARGWVADPTGEPGKDATALVTRAELDAALAEIGAGGGGGSAGLAVQAPPPVGGVPAVVGGYVCSTTTARTNTGTSRIPYIVGVTGTNLRLVFANWLVTAGFADLDNAAPVTIKASVEVGSTLLPVTFGGKLSATIDGGGWVVSDPVATEVTAGQVLYVRVHIAPTTNWYHNRFAYAPGMGGFAANSDLTPPGSAAIPDSVSALYGPALITVEPTGASRQAVQVFGDSIGHGVNDGFSQWQGPNVVAPGLGGGGMFGRALAGVGGLIQSAVPGDSAGNFRTAAGHFRRAVFTTCAPVMICEYGRNDITAGRTLAQVQGDLLWLWRLGAGRGRRVYQTTITPKSTSSNGWVDLAGQTVAAGSGESVRVAFNAWLRAGAPIISASGGPAAVGAAGALLAGQPGHPLTGYLEIADAVESFRDSGLWKPMTNQRTVTDAVTTAGGSTVTSATAAFTATDVGRTIAVAGAGASGALYLGLITAVNSATSVTVSAATATTVTGAATVGSSYTRDGTHLDAHASVQAAAAIPAATL